MTTTRANLSPLAQTPPLQIVITGREKAGKTTLFRYLQSRALHITQAESLTVRRRSHNPSPFSAHSFIPWLSSTTPVVLIRNSWNFTASIAKRIFRRHQTPSVVNITPSTDASPFVLWDAPGETGITRIAKNIDINTVDVIIYVTRLDDTRVEKADKRCLQMIKHQFGDIALNKLLIVLTRGSSLPPINLNFADYVRGRTDILASNITELWPYRLADPSSDDTEEMNNEQDFPANVEESTLNIPLHENSSLTNDRDEDEMNATVNTDRQESNNVSELDLERVQRRKRRETNRAFNAVRSAYMEIDRGDNYEKDGDDYAMEAILGISTNDGKDEHAYSDADSCVEVPEDFLDLMYEEEVSSTDDRVFIPPPKPCLVVTELSELCPIDAASGEFVLPDGTPWFPKLVSAIAEVAEQSRRTRDDPLPIDNARQDGRTIVIGRDLEEGRQDEVEQRENGDRRQTRRRPAQFVKRLKEMIISLSRDGLRAILVEIILFSLVVQTATTVKRVRERRKEKRAQEGDPDTLMSLTDEEYKDLTTIVKEPLLIYENKDAEKQTGGKRKLTREEEQKLDAELFKTIEEMEEDYQRERDRAENPEKYGVPERPKGTHEILGDLEEHENENESAQENK